jgi:hypothetical protein
MSGRITKHSSFVTVTRLVLSKLGGKIIGGNMYGEDIKGLVREFTISGNLGKNVKSPCYHLVLHRESVGEPSDDKSVEIAEHLLACVFVLSQLNLDLRLAENPDKRLSDEMLLQLIDKFIDEELVSYDYFVAISPSGDAIHIVASRINFVTGKAIATWKLEQHMQRGLELVQLDER